VIPGDAVFEPIAVAESVQNDWNLQAVAGATHAGNLLPSRVAWLALHTTVPEIAQFVAATMSVGYRPRTAEVVQVPKLDRTTRPAVDLPVEDQLIYAALITLLQQAIPDGFVQYTGQEQTYEAFEQFPVTVDGARYVLDVDAAGFYQYVDHEKLAYELIGLTGRSDAVEPLVRLLEVWLAERRGLPQGPPPSYVLADVYISPVARALDRAGFDFRRYSDDFRVVGRTWGEVKRAQELVEAAFYGLGLVVAAKKLRTLKIDTYRQQLERLATVVDAGRAIREAVDQLEAEDYIPAIGTRRAVTAEQVIRAKAVFGLEIAAPRVDLASTRLIRKALPVLGSAADSEPLENLRPLLTRYPHLTPNVAVYLQLLMGTDAEGAAIEAATAWLESGVYRYPWQEGWLLHALAHSVQTNAAVHEPARRVLLSDGPWFGRGQAAIALAAHGDFVRQRDFVGVYERAPLATRPDLLTAARIAEPSWSRNFIRGATDRPLTSAVAALPIDTFRDWI